MNTTEKKVDSLEEAKYQVEQCIRDLNACTNYVMVPLLTEMLNNAKEELAFQVATNR